MAAFSHLLILDTSLVLANDLHYTQINSFDQTLSLPRKKRVVRLTHISLASFLWDIGKQNSPRCDAAKRGVPSGAILFAYMNFIEK